MRLSRAVRVAAWTLSGLLSLSGCDREARPAAGGNNATETRLKTSPYRSRNSRPGASGPGAQSASLAPRNVSASEPATTSTRVTYYGQVTREDGRPVAGATVEVVGYRDDEVGVVTFTGSLKVLAQTTASTEGRYVLEPDATARHALRARALDCGDVLSDVTEDRCHGRIRINIVMPPAAVITGRVIDEENRPVPDVPVFAVPKKDATISCTRGVLYAHGVHLTTTTLDGSFTIPGAEAIEYELGVDLKPYAPCSQSVTAPMRDLLVRLQRAGGVVEGTVVRLGSKAPVSSATVVLESLVFAGGRRLWRPGTAVTDESGNFRMERVPVGGHCLRASKAPLVHFGPPVLVNLKDKETTTGVFVTVYPGHTASGTVTEKESGKPLAGVKVSERESGRESLTSPDGRYRLEGLSRSYCFLTADKKGYLVPDDRPYSSGETQLPPDRTEIEKDFKMVRGTAVSGIVRFESGAAVSGARVSASSGRVTLSERTNAAGEYEFAVPPNGSLVIDAKHDGYPPAFSDTIAVEDKPLTAPDIILKAGGSISGLVEDHSGKPIGGAEIWGGVNIPMGTGFRVSEVGNALSDVDGKFTIGELPGGKLSIKASKKGFAPCKDLELIMRPQEVRTGVKLTLQTSHFIAGKVTMPTGKPAENVDIYAAASIGDSGAGATTGPDGSYRVEGLNPGTYRLNASLGDFSSVKTDVKVDSDNVDLALVYGKGVFNGTVVDWKTRQPIQQFAIELRSGIGGELKKDPTRPGRFTVRNLEANCSFNLHISAAGYLDRDESLSIESEEKPRDKVIVMGPGATISGRAIEAGTFKPVADVRVLLYDASAGYIRDGDPVKSTTTGPDGVFSFERVAAGNSQLLFRPATPLAPVTRDAPVQEGVATDVGDVELSGGSAIRGKVLRSPGDQPISGAKIIVTGNRLGITKSCVSAVDGSFSIDQLAGDSYRVEATDCTAQASLLLRDNEIREIVLRTGSGTLKGLVLRRGKPAGGTSIHLTQAGTATEKETLSDAEGLFLVEGLASGPWNVRLRATESGGECRPGIDGGSVDIGIGETERNFTLPGGRIEGRVIGSSGAPKERVMVRCAAKGVSDWSAVDTGADGRFAFENLTPGEYHISADGHDEGYASANVKVVQDVAVGGVDLRLDNGGMGTLISTVLDEEGQPLTHAVCELDGPNGPFGRGHDAAGVAIVPVPAGTYHVSVGSDGYSIGEHTVEIKAGETVRIDDVLYEAGALCWRLTDRNGAPLTNVKCSLRADAPDSLEKPQNGVPDKNGEWFVSGLIPGTYTLQAIGPGGVSLTAKCTVTTGRPIGINTRAN